jgi:hypothetical protein
MNRTIMRFAFYAIVASSCFGCADRILIAREGDDRDLLRALARADTEVLNPTPAMIGANILLPQQSWGPYYLPSYDIYLLALRRECSIAGYVVIDRLWLSTMIHLWWSGNKATCEVPCFEKIVMTPKALNGVGVYKLMTIRLAPIRRPACNEPAISRTLTREEGIGDLLTVLSTIVDGVLLGSVDLVGRSIAINRECWGPYYLGSYANCVYILRNRDGNGGYVVLSDFDMFKLTVQRSIGLVGTSRFPCYSKLSISSGGVVGEGEYDSVEISIDLAPRQWTRNTYRDTERRSWERRGKE